MYHSPFMAGEKAFPWGFYPPLKAIKKESRLNGYHNTDREYYWTMEREDGSTFKIDAHLVCKKPRLDSFQGALSNAMNYGGKLRRQGKRLWINPAEGLPKISVDDINAKDWTVNAEGPTYWS